MTGISPDQKKTHQTKMKYSQSKQKNGWYQNPYNQNPYNHNPYSLESQRTQLKSLQRVSKSQPHQTKKNLTRPK